MTSLVPVDTDLAVRLRRAGLPWHEVAEKCGTTLHLVRRALAKAGIDRDSRYQSPTRKPKGLLSSFQLARMKRLKAAGATWKELGRITGIDPRRLENYVKAANSAS